MGEIVEIRVLLSRRLNVSIAEHWLLPAAARGSWRWY